MKITSVETIALRDDADGTVTSWNPSFSEGDEGPASTGGYDLTVVRVHTDEGISGIGQCEAPSLVIDAIIRSTLGLEVLLVGEDPTEVQRLWQKMYNSTGVFGRRGVVVGAIGAIETALWDIAGKAAGKPVHKLIWRSFTTTASDTESLKRVTPYATVYPPGANLEELEERLKIAVARGVKAVKIEEWPGQFANVDLETDVAVIEKARSIIGPKRDLMIDVQNRWRDVGQAIQTIDAIEEFSPYFIEAPLPADNMEGYRRLYESTNVRIAVGDWGFSTRHEFADLLRRGKLGVVQPSAVRAGGMHEILNIAEDAYRFGALCIPHTWCHVIGVAAQLHLAAITPNMPYFEFPIAFPASPLVENLLLPNFEIALDGTMEVPDRPGLGFELNEEVISEFRVDPY
ncbi:MAG: mandelate racemase/muconate lactonizing enzyme family protein [Chloroflexi bacterium]|jgi:L-alanine-DL-glutamate epimerase-like enolase superfamily enzyme|nr:mandelate racemase/muconate lactonizing enzyme family protein [Chloroflexota bacterium]MBT4943449.1 mandelate racemase/muconate lactonizing enzyme family protein [Chloroflexota bacterium]MBT5252397.1 mandelate racemase/muconate lactonizing enzyme family protein [Chloroflexota bacterium]MBT5893841.1 mandelate racemase/muconate lactonizing enzyme family protein [Chloroflexota bacterium]MBT6706436.1 mandelate racemase/muconate lactonizing enzyme family protein [Chloroflexota bacterium]